MSEHELAERLQIAIKTLEEIVSYGKSHVCLDDSIDTLHDVIEISKWALNDIKECK